VGDSGDAWALICDGMVLACSSLIPDFFICFGGKGTWKVVMRLCGEVLQGAGLAVLRADAIVW
jgi:hypothetical protein